MTCALSEYELRMLHKIVFKGRWCNKHISWDDLMSGTPRSDRDLYKGAIKTLITKGWFKKYKSQSRNDVCIPKTKRADTLAALRAHEGEFLFIVNLDFVR